MDTLPVVIIDDEPDAIEHLQTLLQNYFPQVSVRGSGQSVAEAHAVINSVQPEAVFLDIMLPDGTGFDILDGLDLSRIKVVFTSAHSDFAARAFDFAAIHYLLKPIGRSELTEAVGRIQQARTTSMISTVQMQILSENLNKGVSRLALPNKTGFEMIQINDIIRCEASESYTTFFLDGRAPILVSKPINKYESLLDGSRFFRTHRKHLINLAYVRAYKKGKPGYVVMQDGSTVEVSIRRKDALLAELEAMARF